MQEEQVSNEFFYAYEFVRPGFFRKAIRVVLTPDGILSSTSKNGIDFQQKAEIDYEAIESVNIVSSTKEKEVIEISSVTGKLIQLESRSDGIAEAGRLAPADIDQRETFNTWVTILHQILLSRGLDRSIRFVKGSSSRRLMVLICCIVAACGVVAAVYQNRPGLIALASGIFLILVAFYVSLGTPKPYSIRERAESF